MNFEGKPQSLLTFRVGPVLVCAPSLPIRSIITPPKLTQIAGSDPSTPGIFKHGSHIVRVLDLRLKFGVDKANQTQPGNLVITITEAGNFAFWVDQILDVFDFPKQGWGKLPPAIPRGIFTQTLLLNNKIHLYSEFEKLAAIPNLGYLKQYIKQLNNNVSNTTQSTLSHSVMSGSETTGSTAIDSSEMTDTLLSRTDTKNSTTSTSASKSHTSVSIDDLQKPISTTKENKISSPANQAITNTDKSTVIANNVTSSTISTSASASSTYKPASKSETEIKKTFSTGQSSVLNSKNSAATKNSSAGLFTQKPDTHKSKPASHKSTTSLTTSSFQSTSAQYQSQAASTARPLDSSGNNLSNTTGLITSKTSATNFTERELKPSTKYKKETEYAPVAATKAAPESVSLHDSKYEGNDYESQDKSSIAAAVMFFVLLLLLPAAGIYYYYNQNLSNPYKVVSTAETSIIGTSENTDKKTQTTTQQLTKTENKTLVGTTEISTNNSTASNVDVNKVLSSSVYYADIQQGDNEITITVHEPETKTEDTPSSKTITPLPLAEIKIDDTVKVIESNPVKTLDDNELAKPVKQAEIIKEIVHIVVKGDTLWAIAKKYVKNPFLYPELARLSNIKNPHRIYPGNRVRIRFTKN